MQESIRNLIEKAHVLLEALPYIREFHGKIFVIKYGGHAMVDPSLKESFARDVVLLKYIGINPIIVHGGGPQIGEMLNRLGKKSEFFQGLRITDHETMEVTEMVLGGKVNKEIVALINKHGGNAIGLTGKDGPLFFARKMKIKNEEVDLGFVGEVTHVDPSILISLTKDRFIPVVAPVGADESGTTYNINADIVAAEIAIAVRAEKLLYMTDVNGLLDKSGNLIKSIKYTKLTELIEDSTIKEGMIPKIKSCIKAVKSGVRKIHIVNGKIPHCLLLEIFTQEGIGTEIVQ
ncbi:MAG: acetylglutamate kinase [Thermosulfidibacteraceae bacterium]